MEEFAPRRHAAATSSATPFQCLIVEDHPLMVRSIRASLEALCPGITDSGCVMAVGSLAQATRRLQRREQPALLIIDLNLPDSQGLLTLRALRLAAPLIPIIVFSANDDAETVQGAAALGARAFVSKSALPQSFAEAVHPYLEAMRAGRAHPSGVAPHPVSLLTQRQRAVLAEVSSGYRDREIALRLKIGEQTVRTHLRAIYERLGVQNRTQASVQYLAWAKAHGALD